MPREPGGFGGFDVSHPINRIRAGVCAVAVNVRAYLRRAVMLRNPMTDAILTVSGVIQSIARLNDSTPAGPVGGFTYIIASFAGRLYSAISGAPAAIATGLSTNPISLIPFRPNASVQPWMYTGDSSENVTITTEFALDGSPTTFACFGMLKVRSDGLVYKAGIKEPQNAPGVSTAGTTTTGTDALPATTIPWTNVGGANPTYDYGHTSAGDGTAPVIIALPSGSQTLELTVSGTAHVNGATHAPGDTGPTGSTFPANFTGPGPKIVLGAFTDASGNVLTGTSPVPLLANVGAAVTLQVPSGAEQFQVGIDSAGNTFSANSGSFSVDWTLVSSAIATKVSTLGQVTVYYWGDSPHSGPVSAYIWKNPNDSGSGTPRTTATAAGTVTNNSWQFDSTPEDGTVAMLWDTLAEDGTVTGSIPVFTPALESEGFQDFNMCVVGTLFFPAAGVYEFTFVNKDQIMVGMGTGASVSGGPVTGIFGQTESVVSALPLVYVSTPDGSGGAVTQTIAISVAGPGSIPVEIDYDYWEHTGRILQMTVDGETVPPLPSGSRTDVSYRCKYRSSPTGAQSNPGPSSTPQVTPVLDNTVTCEYSPDPQVDKVDYYRQDDELANFTYVATGPNTNPPTPIIDSLTDAAAANNPTLNFDDFEPFPSIDLPQSGVVNVSGGVITWVSGDTFNTRWLAGTIIEIGAPTPYGVPVTPQLAYVFIARPVSATEIFIPGVPDGTGLVYNIAEPILAAQPLAYLFGPTDNINFTFGVGDSLRPGTLYWCKGSNLDSAPDTNQLDVTDPGEPLVNGAMSGGRGVLFSIKRPWIITPNFYNASATATGTVGSTWTLQATSITRGLYIPRCLAVEGGGRIYFRVTDGIHMSPGGLGSKSITDDELYTLFPHESSDAGVSVPQPVTRNGITVYPPNDAQPQFQQFSIVGSYLYWDYTAVITGTRACLVYDIENEAWIWDMFSTGIGVPSIHAGNDDESIQGTLAGCADGKLRQLVSSGGTEPVTATLVTPAIGGVGWQHMGQITVEYASNAAATLTPVIVDVEQGSYYGGPAITLPSTGGGVIKLKINPSPNKWKLAQFKFQWTDPTLQLYLDGFEVHCADWGGTYRPVRPFSPSGGMGGQL